MGITQGEKAAMDKEGADGVTFGSPDSLGRPFTRIFLRDRAFDQNGPWWTLGSGYGGRDLSGIIVFEFFHAAGFSDSIAKPYVYDMQVHCGNKTSVL